MNSIKKIRIILSIMIIVLSTSACAKATPTEDPSVKITQIAGTVQANLTEVAALTPSMTPTIAATPTFTVTPTAKITSTPTQSTLQATATPTAVVKATSSVADKAVYVSDVTVPDGTWFAPGKTFVKTWAIRNTGTTTWKTAYRLSYLEGLQGANSVLNVHLPETVDPGETVNVSVTFTAPNELGTYYSYWRLTNYDGEMFGEQMSMKIIVGYE